MTNCRFEENWGRLSASMESRQKVIDRFLLFGYECGWPILEKALEKGSGTNSQMARRVLRTIGS